MTKVLVAYGSRHGGTRGIAERIGEVLRTEGLDVEVAAADHVTDVADADAFVVGSGVYMGSWLKEAGRIREAQRGDARRATDLVLQQRAARRFVGEDDRRPRRGRTGT